ncbi:MAG: efflux transporter outer membrane subunit, partial [Burkholderiales bacterium]
MRYDNGYTSYIDVLDAEPSLFDVKLKHTQNHGAVFASLIDAHKAMGGDWVVEAGCLRTKKKLASHAGRRSYPGT